MWSFTLTQYGSHALNDIPLATITDVSSWSEIANEITNQLDKNIDGDKKKIRRQ